LKEKQNQELSTPAQRVTVTGVAKRSLKKRRPKRGIKKGCSHSRGKSSKSLFKGLFLQPLTLQVIGTYAGAGTAKPSSQKKAQA
jgi:hypothetical protein